MDTTTPKTEDEDLAFEQQSADAPIAFQFQDVRILAAKILKRATDQANRKISAAGEQATQIEQAAYDDGHQKGYKEGFAKGEDEGRAAGEAAARREFLDRTGRTVEALETLLKELETRQIDLRSQAEADLMDLALAIARRIVRREIDLDPEYVLPAVREAIGLSTNRSDLTVRLHPDDMAVVEAELPELHSVFTDLGKVHPLADSSLARGEVRVVSMEGEIDLRLDQQFSAIELALLGKAGSSSRADAHSSASTMQEQNESA